MSILFPLLSKIPWFAEKLHNTISCLMLEVTTKH